MSIQEIPITNNQKKQLIKTVKDDSVLFQDDNQDLVVNVAAYVNYRDNLKSDAKPIEDIIGADNLNFDSEFFVFS